MSKGAYIGVNNVARKITKGYVGVGGVARRIKKAYIGIGGVARPCWGEGKPTAYGAITPLHYGREDFPAGSVGNYAIFGSGYSSSDYTSYSGCYTVYNNQLVQSSLNNPITQNSNVPYGGACASLPSYAVFGGVSTYSSGSANGVYAYNTSLSKTTAVTLSNGRSGMGAACTSTYILFAGGRAPSGGRQATVEAYSTSLTKNTNVTSLSFARINPAATSLGTYALFGGGSDGTYETGVVDSYDASLTHKKLTGLYYPDPYDMGYDGQDWAGYQSLAATSTENYALFGGGWGTNIDGDNESSDIVTVYNKSLTRITNTDVLNVGRHNLAATSLKGNALFAGGLEMSIGNIDGVSDVVDAYDDTLTHTVLGSLSVARHSLAAVSVGNFALFAGGASYTTSANIASQRSLKTVDAYTLA